MSLSKRWLSRAVFSLRLTLLLVLFSGGWGAQAQPTSMPAVSVDQPQGGCRLTVWKDGRASITYGAMPKRVWVTTGTFDFDLILKLLLSESHSHSNRSVPEGTGGTVLMSDSGVPRHIDDVDRVRSLLEQAWTARRAPARGSSKEDHDHIAELCLFAG